MKIPSLKDLLKGVPPDDEHLSIIIGLGDIEKSHEAAAIISTSLLELSLKKAIITAFRLKMTDEDLAKVFDFNTTGPLSTFSSKIRIGYALGIFGPVSRDDLEKIKDLRNAFAHSANHLSFDNETIKKETEALYQVRNATLLTLAGFTAKQKFIHAVAQYHWALRSYQHGKTAPYPWTISLP
jgi:DNA-binding MltR family transcriptional regulator